MTCLANRLTGRSATLGLLAYFFAWSSGTAEPIGAATHGDEQVTRMLQDRPAMSHYIAKDGSQKTVTTADAIWQAAAKEYGKIVNGSLINWDKSELQGGLYVAAEHVIPRDGNPALIRIRTSYRNAATTKIDSFDELWANCIFELNNVTNAEKFMDIYHRAILGKVTRKEWVEANTRLEYSALAKLKIFYAAVWLPWSQKNRQSSESECWLRDTPDTYEEWIKKYPRDSPYLTGWRSSYDKSIVPYVKQTTGIDPTGT